jgi:hypothetical protein
MNVVAGKPGTPGKKRKNSCVFLFWMVLVMRTLESGSVCGGGLKRPGKPFALAPETMSNEKVCTILDPCTGFDDDPFIL